ncbi:hypothetical protein MWU76_06510 [Gelidibacter sp. F2691]|nr:hypothetical protein [Gelidibacter sp. F2691]
MKNYYLLLFTMLLTELSFGQTIIYEETFTGQNGKGANAKVIDGPSIDLSDVNWTIDVSNASLTVLPDHFWVENEKLEGFRTKGPAYWYSPSIDMAGYSDVFFQLKAQENNLINSTTIVTQYRIDGTGPWTEAFN